MTRFVNSFDLITTRDFVRSSEIEAALSLLLNSKPFFLPKLATTSINSARMTGNFDGVVHAIGMLFAGKINRFASGSGSIPDPGTTYDKITRQTAFAATAALDALAKGGAEVRCDFYPLF